jgi:hypothetical protein
MRKIIFPVVALAVVVSSFAAVMKMSQDRRELAERLARAEAVSTAWLKIDGLYRRAQDENAALRGRLAIVEASSLNCRADFKDAVADRPKPEKRRIVRSIVPIVLPGYNK